MRVLVSGASGFIGQNIINNKPEDWNITGTYLNHKPDKPNINNVNIDLTQEKELNQLFNSNKFDGVFHLAAITQPNYWQKRCHWTKNKKTNNAWPCTCSQQ